MKNARERPTSLRRDRQALGIAAADLAREAGFTTSKTLRIERAPGRARLADVNKFAEALARLEAAAMEKTK